MPIFDYECPDCGTIFEWMAKFDEVVKCPICWDTDAVKIFPTKAPKFKLTFNPQTDTVDWDGNKSRYWDAWKNLSPADRKKQRIPKHDGDG